MFNKKITTVIKIDGMHCDHCVKSVTKALESIDGVSKVKVDLETKEAIITSKVNLDLNLIKEKITDLNFKVID